MATSREVTSENAVQCISVRVCNALLSAEAIDQKQASELERAHGASAASRQNICSRALDDYPDQPLRRADRLISRTVSLPRRHCP
jgi:hypothetical protein